MPTKRMFLLLSVLTVICLVLPIAYRYFGGATLCMGAAAIILAWGLIADPEVDTLSYPDQFADEEKASTSNNAAPHADRLIYIYNLTDNGETFYIGQTVDMDTRLRQHKRSGNQDGTKKEKRIATMNSRGHRLEIHMLASTRDLAEANELEAKYIRKYGVQNTRHR